MTDENSDIKSLDPCLPEEFLRAYALGKVPKQMLRAVIEAHVELCPECAAKVRSFRRPKLSPDELLEQQVASLRQRQAALKRQHVQGPRPGTIWRTVTRTKSDASGPLVFVLSYAETTEQKLLTVAEVSEDISQAIDTDMILYPQESRLRFRCTVRAGNIFVMHSQNVENFAGELPAPLTQRVQEFCRLGERFDERVPLSQLVFLRDIEGHKLMQRRGVISGMQVTRKDDPRLVAATRSKRLYQYLRVAEPAPKKSESRPVDKHYLTSLLTGLVSELSMWGRMFVPESAHLEPIGRQASMRRPLDLADSGAITESASLRRPPDLAHSGTFTRSASMRSQSSLEDSGEAVKEAPAPPKPGPTREEVLKRVSEKRKFRVGDTIKLSVTVPEDGHLVVVHYCEQTGELEIVFPAPESKFTRVTRNQAIRIERQLVSPPGRYGFKVIFSRENLLPSTQEKVPTGEGTLKNLMVLVERIEELDERAWREATFEYEIVKKKGFFSRWFS